MAVSLATLVARTRRFVRDWPEEDVLTASVASNTGSIDVSAGLAIGANWLLEIDQETLFVVTSPGGNTLTVRRGQRGSVAASHANQATVLVRPHFLYGEILDALNWAKDECFPLIYKDVLDTSLTTASNIYEYTVPNFGGLPIRYISQVEVKPVGEPDFRRLRGWSIRRGATPFIQLSSDPDPGAPIRIHGYSPFPDLVTGGSTDSQWPDNAIAPLVFGAASFLMASGEAGRVRVDTGVIDDREQANRVGSSMNAANALDSRFRRSLLNAAMPPLPKHAKPTF